MQIVSTGENLHEMSNPIFCEKWEKYFKIMTAKSLPGMLSIKGSLNILSGIT